jgi:hypothetical protein
MRHMLTLVLLAAAATGRADDIEPAVATSSAALAPAAPAPAATSAAVPAKGGTAAPAAKGSGKPAAAAGQPVGAKSTAHDQIELDRTQITGNSELPNVMYVVPWKRPDLGDFAGRPAKSLVDEALAPVDRDVFRRQNRYFSALQADGAARPAPPAAVPAPASGSVTGDEK